MFAALLAGALLAVAHPDHCRKALPDGPAVPAPIVLSTDCGWFGLDTAGSVTRLPVDWYAKHKSPWHPAYRLTIKRTHSGRYVVLRDGRVIWRSAGYYYNEAGTTVFGPHAFAFDSWGREGVMLTDLRGPERLVVRGRHFYPTGFTRGGDLFVVGRPTIVVLAPGGKVLRRYAYRRTTGSSFDDRTGTLYFVTPGGMLSAARGSAIRRIARVRSTGWIELLGRRLLTLTSPHHVAVLRRDGVVVAHASWPRRFRGLDSGVATSDDGRLFAFRATDAHPGARTLHGVVYLLRAGDDHARAIYRDHIGQPGCGGGVSLSFHGSALLYRSVDSRVVAKAILFGADDSRTTLTQLLRGLPRKSRLTPGNVFWASDFLP